MGIRILDVNEVAKLLKIDPQTISRKAQKGEISGFKIGNRWRFKLSDIENWIDQKIKSIDSKYMQMRVFDQNTILGMIAELFRKRNDAYLVYLFGSQATGKASRGSDIDIAVYLKEGEKLGLDKKLEISSRLMTALSAGNIDVVLLNDATPILRYEVIRDGILAFKDPSFDPVSYKIKILREYYDTENIRKINYSYFLEAVNF